MRTSGVGALIVAAMLFAADVAPATAAQSTPGAPPAAEFALPEVRWELAEATMADGTVPQPDDPALYTIQFLPDGAVVARADCNEVAGAYQLDGDSLSLAGLATTLVGCPEPSLGADYAGWLDRVAGFEVADDALILILDDGGWLRFAPSLTGVGWEWQRFLGGNDSVLAPEHPEDYTIQFEEDGLLLFQADCILNGTATGVVSGSRFAYDLTPVHDNSCGADSLDREFLRLLSEVTSFTFLEGRLVLALPVDAGVLIFEARAIDPAVAPDAEATPGGN